jgi:hypothetical protein
VGRGGTGGRCAEASAEERRVMRVALICQYSHSIDVGQGVKTLYIARAILAREELDTLVSFSI